MRITHIEPKKVVLYQGKEVVVMAVYPSRHEVWIVSTNPGELSRIVKADELKGKP